MMMAMMMAMITGVAMLAEGSVAAEQGREVAGCPATYQAVKALLRGSPRMVQGGRQAGDEAYATFSEYSQARPRLLGTTVTSVLIHTPRDNDGLETGRVIFRLPGADREQYLPAFKAVYGEEASDGEAYADSGEMNGALSEASVDSDWGPFAVFKRDTTYLLCEYNVD